MLVGSGYGRFGQVPGNVLLCLSVNRFLLAGLSAALPHTVADEDLVTANSLTPTAGTLALVHGLRRCVGGPQAYSASTRMACIPHAGT